MPDSSTTDVTAVDLTLVRARGVPQTRSTRLGFRAYAPAILLVAPLSGTLRANPVFLTLAACLVAALVLFSLTISPPATLGRLRGSVSDGVFTTRSLPRPRRAALGMLGIGVLAAVISIAGPQLLRFTPRGGFVLTLTLVPLVIIATAIWTLVRASRTADITLDRAGVTLSKARTIPWNDATACSSSDTVFSVTTADGKVHDANVAWLESDPYLVAEMAAFCISAPAARDRVGRPLLDDLVASRAPRQAP